MVYFWFYGDSVFEKMIFIIYGWFFSLNGYMNLYMMKLIVG